MTASVSVIIPAHNAARFLSIGLTSALRQDPAPSEVIVVDDGSTDETAEVAAGFGDRIVFIRQANAGQGAARNAGLAVAEGRYVAFLDADDFWRPGFVAACVDFLERHDEAVAVNTGYAIRRRGVERIGPAGLIAGATDAADGFMLENFFATWARHDHVRTGTAMIRRSVIDQAGPQRADLRISQDLEYWGYIATFGPWGFIPRPLWVGDSADHAVAGGWMKRYRKRRRLCPTVEQWQERILPRLRAEDVEAFKVVRGRVAGNYAQSKILGGDPDGARRIVRRYGDDFPPGVVMKIMRTADRFGPLGWRLGRALVAMRERTKAGMPLRRKPPTRTAAPGAAAEARS